MIKSNIFVSVSSEETIENPIFLKTASIHRQSFKYNHPVFEKNRRYTSIHFFFLWEIVVGITRIYN